MDYSQYLYTQRKKEKLVKKNTKINVIKELKMSPKISENDYQVRYRAAVKFITKGYKVKVSIFFRGREITHKELGINLLNRFIEEIKEIANIDNGPTFSGSFLSMLLSPNKKIQ